MMNKKIILLAVMLFTGFQTFAQLNFPNPSPDGHVKQELGFTEIEINYSRPGVKGRTIFGGLVPYGELWRTGAHDATTIRFSDPVHINGNSIPAGTYSLFSIPGKEEWTIILNTETEMHGTAAYDEADDLLRFTVKPEPSARFYESFTIELNDLIQNTANLYITWENTQVKMNISTQADEVVMAEIHDRINEKKEDRASLFYQSSLYYFNEGKDLEQALQWIKIANQKSDDFMYLQLQAKIEAALGHYKAAIESAKSSSRLAKEKQMDQIVATNEKLIREWKKGKNI